ncbi:erythromycin esterase family protein [Streptomyces roseirectus]|uniref:Erythromycin esterase family protein n=1 Tax=Streptomyces roseirectus TaxID=2768066 RepID=A0A7H0IRN6_9ACTN|nr:erythromycin esterase family protein [Streptomyces roseirectus]QNP75452.1 erythromycin esterase family protein [Streptomyces roseirectus]
MPTQPEHTLDAAALLALLPTRPRILALGEPVHGEETLLELRNDVFRQLVEDHGYRTIALESDCLRALLVDDHITTGTGTLDDVMTHGFSHDHGTSPANRALVRWMRAHNETRPATDHVHFAGLDAPWEITHAESPRAPLTALHTHLAGLTDLPCTAETLDDLLGPDDEWTDPAAMTDPTRSKGRSPEARHLRLLTDDLTTLLAQHPHSARPHLHARTATALLRYHHWMADPTPARMTRLCALRDATMADNLHTLATQAPVLVHAHNSHLQRDKSTMRMWQGPVEWWSAGALTTTSYAFIATAIGTLPHRGITTPPPDTLEGTLYTTPHPHHFLTPAHLPTTLTPRTSPWFGYAPLAPSHLPGIDALLYVKDVHQKQHPTPLGHNLT